ncbi:MAG: hypothetical protein GY723_04060 [bacterium]|nr:hypothetical protein [bacterium]MCP5070224.1 hypothetical protein [bacterium]
MAGPGELGIAAFILASLVVGSRLILLARRTRCLPELALGVGLFTLGGVDYLLNMAARSEALLPDAGRALAMIAAVHCGAIGIIAIAVFTTRVFHPGSRIAAALVGAAGLALIACGIAQGLTTGYLVVATHEDPALFIRVFNLIQAAILAWTAVDASRYGRKLGRRVSLGLEDPVVSDRIRLWSRAAMIASGIYVIYAAGEALGGDLLASSIWNPVLAGLGFSSATCLWLAFFPPLAYGRWIRERSARATD